MLWMNNMPNKPKKKWELGPEDDYHQSNSLVLSLKKCLGKGSKIIYKYFKMLHKYFIAICLKV